MAQSFTTTEIDGDKMSQALPLLRATWPEIDLAAWQEFATAFRGTRREEGVSIVGLLDSAGGLCGLFACRLEHELCEGRVLSISLFTAVDIANSLEPVRALLAAAEAKAKFYGCGSLRIRLSRDQSELVNRLRGLGLARSAVVHSLTIGAPAFPQ